MCKTKSVGKFAFIEWENLDNIAYCWAHRYFDEGSFDVFVERDGDDIVISAPCAGPERKWTELFAEFDKEKNFEVEHSVCGLMALRALRNDLAQECGFEPQAMYASEYGVFFFNTPLEGNAFISE